MSTETELSVEERIFQVLKHLGIKKAHLAARLDADWRGLAIAHPEVIASLTLVLPMAMPQDLLAQFGSRLTVFVGDQGAGTEAVQQAMPSLPDANFVRLPGYTSIGWSNVAADRSEEMRSGISEFLTRLDNISEQEGGLQAETQGEVAGIRYQIQGSGAPLVLLPLQLAPSQWEPIVPELSQSYCTVTLTGAHLGHAANLESRGKTGFSTLVKDLIENMRLQPGQRVLDVGCGTGVCSRLVARVTDGSNPVTGIDISPYLLREAVSLTGNESLDKFIEYREGSAEAIPFDDDTFDATMAITMMEEADAEVVLSELVRVTRPGGRVAVVVRALDMPGWSSLPLRPELKKKLEATTFGGREPQGCADAALYQLFRNAGLTNLKRYPQLVTVEATTPTALNYYSTMMSRTLSGDELEEWRAARAKAEETGSYFLAMPYHCAVGTKP